MGRPRLRPDLNEEEYKEWQKGRRREYLRSYREKARAEGKLPPLKYRHGERSIYNDFEAYIGRTYNLSLEEYAHMFKDQGEGCYICGTRLLLDGSREQGPYIDHCHEEGHVRALLCLSCNTGLGTFRDNPELLRKAALYIEENRHALT